MKVIKKDTKRRRLVKCLKLIQKMFPNQPYILLFYDKNDPKQVGINGYYGNQNAVTALDKAHRVVKEKVDQVKDEKQKINDQETTIKD